jgi:hypothetical protein
MRSSGMLAPARNWLGIAITGAGLYPMTIM